MLWCTGIVSGQGAGRETLVRPLPQPLLCRDLSVDWVTDVLTYMQVFMKVVRAVRLPSRYQKLLQPEFVENPAFQQRANSYDPYMT
jgi:hypothetical protein